MNNRIKNIFSTPALFNFSVVYFAATIGESYADFLDNQRLELFFKPFLSISLFVYYLTQSKKKQFWYIVVIVLSGIADISDIISDKVGFIPSIAATNAYYLIFLIYFIRKNKFKEISINRLIMIALLISGCTSIIFVLIYPNMNNLEFIASLINSILLICLCSVVFNYFLKHSTDNNLLYLFSFFLLVIANSAYGLTSFNDIEIHFLKILFISLYAISHYLICNLILLDEEKN